jgi:(p)ppGpp synthase/HD superfamily hydrolase
MKELVEVLKAADAAARWHVHQRRKGVAQEPYMNHLLEVAALVAEATDGAAPKLVIAALLHDTVEDCEVPLETIKKEYGKKVAGLVGEVTDDKKLEKNERKRLQVENAPHKSNKAKILKLADKTSNLRALTHSPAANWSNARRLEYLEWARDVAKGLRGVKGNGWLEKRFDDAAEEAQRSIAL